MGFANREYLLKMFPKQYIEHGLNGTKAYKAIRPHVSSETAGVEANRTLKNPKVKREIELLMEKAGLTVDSALEVHKRNMHQDKNLHVSQTAVQDVYKLKGLLGTNSSADSAVNVAVIIEN